MLAEKRNDETAGLVRYLKVRWEQEKVSINSPLIQCNQCLFPRENSTPKGPRVGTSDALVVLTLTGSCEVR